MFFSTFEELKLPATGPMDHVTTILYEQSPTPILYVAPCDLMLGRAPLFPLFLKGNSTPTIVTIPHKLRHLQGSAFQFGNADAAAAEGRRGSNVYEVKPWLWQFGQGRPRIGGLPGCPCLRPRKGATLSTGQIRRGVTRPAAAARQPGAEMNETYGMSTSEGKSQDN